MPTLCPYRCLEVHRQALHLWCYCQTEMCGRTVITSLRSDPTPIISCVTVPPTLKNILL